MNARRLLDVVTLARVFEPGHYRYLEHELGYSLLGRPARPASDDDAHLRAAADWIAAAQDSQPDGGISGRYKLAAGWSSSYPETTGYLIPTLMSLARHFNDDAWTTRAGKAVEFLLSLQLGDGAFPGGEVAANRTAPSPFNTAQIVHGLNAWYGATGDSRAKVAAEAAAAWLVQIQDGDGAFRRFYYGDLACTYSAHLSCWLAEHGRLHADEAALSAAARNLDWVLQHRDRETGWFDKCGFDEEQHRNGIAFIHTIAYTVWGVLTMGLLLEREDAVAAAAAAAERLLRRLELSGCLPGIVDQRWKPAHAPQCLTGNAQMALIWLKLYESHGDLRFVNASLKALDHVKRAQDLQNPNPGIRGGVAGSFPIWGDYISMAFPNWAAKFFIDAMLEKRRVVERLSASGTIRDPRANCVSVS